ncbi:MAG: outer membrane lipoprotein-sorting protein [Treponemataceae bacterium]|nr:outer membrane lipoprotein-sorting protein [Treponemataceae bacterium]
MKLTAVVKCAAMAAVCAAGSAAFAIDATTVMQQAHDVEKPLYTMARVQMDLIEKNGSLQESRIVTEYGRDKDGLSSIVMVFNTPASVKDTRFLQIENKGRDDDKWIYLPALKSTRRVAASEGSKSFMGTDASYDDMSTREVDEDVHELISESEEKNGYTCWVVKSTPKDGKSSQYLYRINYIDQETNYPVYTEMYDKKGKLLKTLTLEKLEKVANADGTKTYDIPKQEYMVNVQTGHSTRLTIQQLKLDSPIPDRIFTSSFLNTGK